VALEFVPHISAFPISGYSQIMPQVPSLSQENPDFTHSPILLTGLNPRIGAEDKQSAALTKSLVIE